MAFIRSKDKGGASLELTGGISAARFCEALPARCFLMVPVLSSLPARRSDACELRLLLHATFLLFICGAAARRPYYRFFSLTPPLLMSTRVRTAPSILLSAVRYGRMRSE